MARGCGALCGGGVTDSADFLFSSQVDAPAALLREMSHRVRRRLGPVQVVDPRRPAQVGNLHQVPPRAGEGGTGGERLIGGWRRVSWDMGRAVWRDGVGGIRQASVMIYIYCADVGFF